jgi:hypothetical protein
MTPQSEPHHPMTGLYITATRNRTRRSGVLLGPAPGSRARSLRLAQDDGTAVRLDPGAWTLEAHHTLLRGKSGSPLALTSRNRGLPTYRYQDLPPAILATKTMLRTQHRRTPGPKQQPVAYYDAKEFWAPLYAIIDTVAMAPLPTKRAEAWTAVRTCIGCSQVHPRPLERSPEGDRYCALCHESTALTRWTEQARPVQQQMAAWAREVLADPATVLGASAGDYSARAHRVENTAGDILLDARIRDRSDITGAHDPGRYADTVSREEIAPAIAAIAARRIITWHGRELSALTGSFAEPDALARRHSLWSGGAPAHRNGAFWYPTPELHTWNYSSPDAEYRAALTPAERTAVLRTCLQAMAHDPAPEPGPRQNTGA